MYIENHREGGQEGEGGWEGEGGGGEALFGEGGAFLNHIYLTKRCDCLKLSSNYSKKNYD